MDEPGRLAFDYARRFGLEIELNALDGRDFKKQPLQKGELPEGSEYIGIKITELLGKPVDICRWHHTHDNAVWVIKPDSSCGLEVCSPVSKGWVGLKEICQVVELFRTDPRIKADARCSLHVHVDVSDMCQKQTDRGGNPIFGGRIQPTDALGTVLAYWVKCEPVFLDSVPAPRKRNRYCQCIGMCDVFDHEAVYSPQDIIQRLGQQKYFTINTFHLVQHKRTAIEFRIVENEGCRDPYLVKNWVRLLVHFIEVAKRHPFPRPYEKGDRWSSLLWLDPEDVMTLLGFVGGYELSRGLEQTRNWFLARLNKNLSSPLSGVWSEQGRSISRMQIDRMVSNLGLKETINEWLCPTQNREAKLYAREFQR